MKTRDLLTLALAAVRGHALRSFLTMLGISIGITSVILLTSIGEGTRQYVLGEFTQFGTNIIAIHPGRTATTGIPGAIGSTIRKLTLGDAEAVLRLSEVEYVVPLSFGLAEVEHLGRGRSVFIYGVNADVPKVWKFEVLQGRFLPTGDLRRSTPVTALGPKLKRELFGDANALGSYVRIGGRRFQVIGVMAAKGQLLGFDVDDSAYIPVASALELFGLKDELIEIDVLFTESLDSGRVASRIEAVLRERHDDELDFTITTQDAMLSVMGRVLAIINMAVGAIGGVSLVVGAIGILTMMWISVNERTAEIGLMRALGAAPEQVLRLFLVEALMLSFIGGLIGVAAGIGIARGIQLAIPGIPVRTPIEFVVIAIVVSLVVGLLSGVLPARRAAALDPVEALRAE